MQKIAVSIIISIFMVTPVIAGQSCYTDRIVGRWIQERDNIAVQVLQEWARGKSVSELTPAIASIISNELLTCSKCRNDIEFVKEKLILLNNQTEPKVENVPAIILEHYLGEEMFSPYTQFPRAN